MNQKIKTKIAVVGAGAIGSVLGGLLAHAGEDVTLISRKAHIDAINKNGLFMDGVLGELKIKVKATEKLNFKPDLVLLPVKTQDVEKACEEIKPYVKDIPIVTMQNGVRSDEIASSVFGKENIISCVVNFGAMFLEPGKVTYRRKGFLIIGEAFSKNRKRVNEIALILNKAKYIKTEISNNIHGAHWTKLLGNLIVNCQAAMTGLTLGECGEYSILRKIVVMILREAFQVIEKVGIKLEPLPTVRPSLFRTLTKLPLPLSSLVIRILSRRFGKALSSTLQSILRGKPTEIDYLNGEIVRLGKKMSIPTPYNSKVVELVYEVEKTHKFYSPGDLKKIFKW